MPTYRKWMILLGLLMLGVTPAFAGVMVSVETNTPSIPADGKSYAQVLITVLEQTGAPVSDGTEVRLTTSAGDVSPVVYTTAGRAVGIVTSSTCAQIATINASADGAAGSTQIEFVVSSGDEAAVGSGRILMSGGSLAYCVEQDAIVGSSGVTMQYRGLTVTADSIQLNQAAGQIRAQGNVKISKGAKSISAVELACDIRGDKIYVLSSYESKDIRAFDVGKLDPVDFDPAKAPSFTPLVNVSGKTWIVSSKLTLIPSQKLLFYKTSIYVGNSKVVTLPYYSYSYSDRQSILQQIHYTSNDGMLVDMPFYCRLTESSASAVKLRYSSSGGETGGYTRPRRGPSLGLQQDYLTGDSGRGTVFIDSIGSSSQACELAHHLDYGSPMDNGRADISARFQPSSSYAKNIYSATASMSGVLPRYSYSVLGYFGGSRIKESLLPGGYLDQSNCSLRAVVRSKQAIALGWLGNLFPSLTVGYGTPSGLLSSTLYQSLGVSSVRNKPISGTLSAGFEQSSAFTMTGSGATGSEMRLRPSLRTSWAGGNASINYTLNLRSGLSNGFWNQGKHQIGASLTTEIGSRCSVNSSVDFGLDAHRLNLLSTVRYRPARLWEIRSSYDLYRYSYDLNAISYSYTTSRLQTGIYHPVGIYEVGLVWSPNGQQYGVVDQGRHLWLELSGIGF